MTPRQQTWGRLKWAALFLIVAAALCPPLLSSPRYTVNASSDIRDGVIKNADVNSSAAIDWTKINSGITITPTELNLFDPSGRTNGTVPTSNGSNSITWTGPYLTSYSETDPSSLHTSGGTMSGTITAKDIVPVSNNIWTLGASGNVFQSVYATNFGNPAGFRFLQIDDGSNVVFLNNTTSSGHVQITANNTNGRVDLISTLPPMLNVPTASTVGAAGGASALPATPIGYFRVLLSDGTTVVKMPYYTD